MHLDDCLLSASVVVSSLRVAAPEIGRDVDGQEALWGSRCDENILEMFRNVFSVTRILQNIEDHGRRSREMIFAGLYALISGCLGRSRRVRSV